MFLVVPFFVIKINIILQNSNGVVSSGWGLGFGLRAPYGVPVAPGVLGTVDLTRSLYAKNVCIVCLIANRL